MKNSWQRLSYKYRYFIFGGLGLIFLAFVSWLILDFYNQKLDEQAEEDIYSIHYKMLQAEKKKGGNLFQLSVPFYSQKTIDNIAELEKEIASYKNYLNSLSKARPSHLFRALELSYFLIKNGQKKEALDLLNQIELKFSSKNWIGSLLKMQLGSLFLDEKNYERALYLFFQIISNKQARSFHLEASVKMALSYEGLQQFDKARQIYQKIQSDQKTSLIYERRARDYDRLMRIRKKVGSL